MREYKNAPKSVHYGASVLTCIALVGVFWFLDRQHDRGPLGLHDSVALGAILLFVLAVAYPDRLAKLGGLLSSWRRGPDAGK